MRFSAPVTVTGSPALKLETGVVDREAVWVNTTNANSSAADSDTVAVEVEGDDSVLLFEYTVVTGDSADDLDYWSDEEVAFAGVSDLPFTEVCKALEWKL